MQKILNSETLAKDKEASPKQTIELTDDSFLVNRIRDPDHLNKRNYPSANKSNISKGNEISVTNVNNVSIARSQAISTFSSSNTLQNSVLACTFPKEKRFRKDHIHLGSDALYAVSTPKMPRAAGIGYGTRTPVGKVENFPSPQEYRLIGCFDEDISKNKGYSMSISLPYKKDESRNIPGPGEYFISKAWIKDYPIEMCPRRGMYYDEGLKQKTCLSPQKYSPSKSDKMVTNRRFIDLGIGIGLGSKQWNKMTASISPGVGSYNLPSIFDKSRKYKYALN